MEPLQIKPQVEVPESRSSRDGVSGRYARSRVRAASKEAQRHSGGTENAGSAHKEQLEERRSERSRRTHRNRRQRSKGDTRTQTQQQQSAGAKNLRAEAGQPQAAEGSFAASLESKASGAQKAAAQTQLGSTEDRGLKQEPASFQAPQTATRKLQSTAQLGRGAVTAKTGAVSARAPEAAPVNGQKGSAEAVKLRAEAKAPAEAAPTAERDQASDVLRQVRLQLFPEARTATVHLKPAELGRVSIKIVVNGDEVQAVVRAETPEALAALEQHMPELQASLSDRGFADAELDLALGFEGEAEEHLSGERAAEPSPDHLHRLFANAEGVDFYA